MKNIFISHFQWENVLWCILEVFPYSLFWHSFFTVVWIFVMQVAVLRVRLEELEDEVKSKTSRLDELEKDRERILRDHTDSSGLHSQALDTLKVCLFILLL